MKNRANKQGYIKVSDTFMLDELLNSVTKPQLLSCHIDELNRIKTRLDRSNYISAPQRNYLTNLYIDVVLNGKSFREVKTTPKKKRETFSHIGMIHYQKFLQLNS